MRKLLFICLGNICRSPAAHGVMQAFLEQQPELNGQYFVDSAGILSLHEGSQADARMRHHAAQRGYSLESLSRPVRYPQDFEEFDFLFAMDKRNLKDLHALDESGQYTEKIKLFSEFFTQFDQEEVPDPYYGGEAGFELVFDMVEEGCRNMINKMQAGEL